MPAVIMSGRDCIGIAKTGSGKTLAFVLPMLRHVKDQPPLVQGDGPVALSMAPTRELVVQVCRVMTACVVLRQFAVWRAGLVVTEICPLIATSRVRAGAACGPDAPACMHARTR